MSSKRLVDDYQMVMVSIGDEARNDALRRATYRVENQYAVLIRRGHRTAETARQMLTEIELLRDQLKVIEGQASKLLENFGG